MSYLMENIPYQKVWVRKEYLHDREYGHGLFVEARAHAVRAKRGNSLWFQCFLGPPYGGAHFLLPITALCGKPSPHPTDIRAIQPFDCFSDHFTVLEQKFTVSGAAFVLPDWDPAQYLFTLDFGESDLAEDPDQHKMLHIVERADGGIGAYPNTRLIIPDPVYWPTMDKGFKVDLKSLDLEVRAEGNQDHFDPLIQPQFYEPDGSLRPTPQEQAPLHVAVDPWQVWERMGDAQVEDKL